MKYKSLLLPLIMMIATVTILFELGSWQWQRKQDKEALIARIEHRAYAVPRAVKIQELLDAKTLIDELDYTPVMLKGHFVSDKSALIFTNIEEGSAKFSGPGYDLLSVFAADEGGYILVNRGFLPPEYRTKLPVSTVMPQITLTGLVRRPERRSYVDVPDQPERREFAVREPKSIIPALGYANLEPIVDNFYIELRTPLPDNGLPQPYKTNIQIPNNHLQYVLTWWGFALVFTIMFGVVLVRRFRQVQ